MKPLVVKLAFGFGVILVGTALARVTHAALEVEETQRRDARRAERTNQERIALWRLDGAMLPLLSFEANRPVAHYRAAHYELGLPAPGCSESAPLLLASPLASGTARSWMLLHVELTEEGWESPQVSEEITPERQLLHDLRRTFPPKETLEQLVDASAKENGVESSPIEIDATAFTKSKGTYDEELKSRPDQFAIERGSALTSSGESRPFTPSLQAARDAGSKSSKSMDTKGKESEPKSSEKRSGREIAKATSNSGEFDARRRTAENFQGQQQYVPYNSAQMLRNDSDREQAIFGGSKNGPSFREARSKVGAFSLKKVEHSGASRLFLVRTVVAEESVFVQGIVLDWDKLCQELTGQVADLFPKAQMERVVGEMIANQERTMSTLPIALNPGTEDELPPAGWTPLRFGLVLVWGAAFVAVVAVGIGGWALLALSERRIRFVWAVTHELRTPLTTLRLYLDLLTGGFVTEEKVREEYLVTLARESDRLQTLVENVLDFARLEKRSGRPEPRPMLVAELLQTVLVAWEGRCRADGLELKVISHCAEGRIALVDERLTERILGNLIDNARKYGKNLENPEIQLVARDSGDRVLIEVIDFGPGIDPAEAKVIWSAFRRGRSADATAGGVGLGLSLARQWAESFGARLTLIPTAAGACFRLDLRQG